MTTMTTMTTDVHALDTADLVALDRRLQADPSAIEPDALVLHDVRHPAQLVASAAERGLTLPSQLASMIDVVFELQRPYEDLRAGSSQLKVRVGVLVTQRVLLVTSSHWCITCVARVP